MDTSEMITLVAAALAFLASVTATGVVAYYGRFGRFTSERWWGIKVEAYSRIVEALTHLVYYYEQHYDAQLERREIPDARRQEISDYWRKADLELKRATAAGSFTVSEEAADALRAMWKAKASYANAHPGDWVSLIERDYAAAEACLQVVVAAAHRDLRVEARSSRLARGDRFRP